MRNPRRWRTIALTGCVLGAALVTAAFRLPERVGDGVRIVLFMLGGTGVLFGPFLAWFAHRAARAQQALARGEEVLARWRIDAANWRAFIAAEPATTTATGLDNELSSIDEVPADGFEIIVGEEAIDIGGCVHVLPRHGAPEVLEANLREGNGGPHVAELRLRHPPEARRNGGMTPPRYTRLSFPVAPDAWRDARRAIGHYSLGRPGKASFFHGRGDGSDPEDLSTCAKCGYRTHRFGSTCPKCGGGMLSKRWTRRFGVVLVMLGGVLFVGMSVILFKLSPMLARPGVEMDGTRFDGTRGQALMIWAILAAVWVFGATATGLGVQQLVTGRRNLKGAYVMLGIFSAMVVIAGLLQ